MDCVKESRIPLKPHQERVVETIINSTNSIGVIHTPGSGKTLSAATAAHCFLVNNGDKVKGVVVIAPSSLKHNFVKEFNAAFGEMPENIFVTTFESFTNNPVDLTGQLLIIDEVHTLKTKITGKDKNNPKTGKRAFAIIKESLKANKVLILTATPLINNEYDIENLLAIIDRRMPRKEKVFQSMLDDKRQKRRMLEGRFDFYSPSPEDLEYYPKVERIEKFFKMPPTVYDEYSRQEKILISSDKFLVEELMNEDAEISGGDFTRFYMGLRVAGNLNEKTELEMEEFRKDKASWISFMMQETPGEKWLIYSDYKGYGINIVKSVLSDNGFDYEFFTGDTPTSERQEIIERMNKPLGESSKAKALLVTKAGGTGIDLKGFTRAVILEAPWNIASIEQVFGRIVRYKSLEGTPFTTVKTYIMMMVKPEEYDAGHDRVMKSPGSKFNGKLKSIDLLLYSRSLAKKYRIDNLFEDMKMYNTALDTYTRQLRNSAIKLKKDFEEFTIYMKSSPSIRITFESDTANVDSHTVFFSPEESFHIKICFRIISIPVFDPSMMASRLNKDYDQFIFKKNDSFLDIYYVIYDKDKKEMTFDRIVNIIESKTRDIYANPETYEMIRSLTPYVNSAYTNWNHIRFMMNVSTLKKINTAIACISSRFIGDRQIFIDNVSVDRRDIVIHVT